ncbi:hypothetical protein BDV33DRAFT_199788 [Aspergillus novoparasiticus]|uniref:Uncharacterized protein n=1 Tax=Aspergillus novoparasiticus TaxID=986946 RepID=A0A5N6F5L6_9EURO|nr:hypothetical protein BDV33DRAFT_199788 [Aspergillus novoparasiticus]
MTIHGYGVWVGLPMRYYAERASQRDPSPHIYLCFRDDHNSGKERKAAINVKSLDEDSRVVLDLGFQLIIQTLSSRNNRFNNTRLHGLEGNANDDDGAGNSETVTVDGLDYIRLGDLLPGGLAAGLPVPFD